MTLFTLVYQQRDYGFVVLNRPIKIGKDVHGNYSMMASTQKPLGLLTKQDVRMKHTTLKHMLLKKLL